jgi:hypothetical protein
VSAPTYEELAALVVASQARIAGQDAAIAELERQLAAFLRNSSQPPSTRFTAAARAALTGVEPVQLDETGLRAAGQLAPAARGLHRRVHRLFCPRKRDEAIDAAGVLPHFIGIAVHDVFASYGRDPVATHALCTVPLLRALIAAVDHRTARGATAVAMPTGWCWAARVIGALVALKAIPDIGAPPDSSVLAASRRPIVSAALIGASAEVGPAGAVGRRHRAPARRIRSRLDDYLRLAPDLRGTCDSNPVHRDIRMAKIEPPGASAPSPARRTSPRCGRTPLPRPSTAADPSTSAPNSPAGTSGSPGCELRGYVRFMGSAPSGGC